MIFHYNFTASLLIAAELNFNISKNLCKCGEHILYDPLTSSIYSNGYKSCCYKKLNISSGGGFSEKFYKEKYGENYKKIWDDACKERCRKAMETHEKRQNGNNSLMGVSKASNDFFKILYDKLKNKENIYTDFLNHEYVVYLTKKDLDILNKNNINKHIYYLDFWQNNKVIEFNGTYWHKNLQLEDSVKKKILEENHNMKVLFVDECEYYKNKEKIINECINFLENE